MNAETKGKFSSTFWRYLAAFCAVVLLVIVVMGIYLYNYYYRTMYADFVATNREYLSAVHDSHENDIVYISNISVQLGISDVSKPFKLENEPLKSMSLKSLLHNFLVVSPFYDKLYLLFDVDEYLYTEYSSIKLDRFLDSGLLLEQTTASELEENLRGLVGMCVLAEQEISGFLEGPEQGVLYLLPIQPGGTGTLLFVVGSSYYDTLMASENEDLRYSLILNGNTILSARGELPAAESELLEKLAAFEEDGHWEIQLGGEKYLLTVQRGESGFIYYTMQSADVFQRKFFSGQWGMLLFLLLLTIPITLVVFWLLRRFYRPVGTIRQMLRQQTGGDDFDAIQSGIQELLGHNQELVEQSTSLRRSEMIRNFVRGAYTTREQVIEQGAKVGLSLDREYYAVLLAGSSQSLDDKPVLELLLKAFGHDERVTGYGSELLSHNQTLFVLFTSKKEDIYEFANRLRELGKVYCDNFVLAVSYPHRDFENVSVAYLEANTAYDSRFLTGESEVLRFDNVASGQNDAPLSQMYIDALKNALRSRDAKAVDSIINEILRHIRSSKQSLFTFRVLYNQIISVLIREWDEEKLGSQHIYDIFTLSRCLSLQDLDEMLRDTCRMLLENKPNAEQPDDKMQQAAAYMRENYSDGNLNMNALAEHLSISTVALSVEFKQAMGMSPSDYLTLLRIERAKQLLADTELTVREISAAVGYYDVPGFVRRFKKYTAQTPAQFRQNTNRYL